MKIHQEKHKREDQEEEHIETQVSREDLDKKQTNKHNSEFRWHFQSETNAMASRAKLHSK